MPPTERTTLNCPQCGQPADVEIWQLLDLAREPDQRRRFLQGNIDSLTRTFADFSRR